MKRLLATVAVGGLAILGSTGCRSISTHPSTCWVDDSTAEVVCGTPVQAARLSDGTTFPLWMAPRVQGALDGTLPPVTVGADTYHGS